jgi:hypothetical protein
LLRLGVDFGVDFQHLPLRVSEKQRMMAELLIPRLTPKSTWRHYQTMTKAIPKEY